MGQAWFFLCVTKETLVTMKKPESAFRIIARIAAALLLPTPHINHLETDSAENTFPMSFLMTRADGASAAAPSALAGKILKGILRKNF